MRVASLVGLTLLTNCSAWGQEWVYKADAPEGLATNLIYDSAQGMVKGFGSEASYSWDGVSWSADVREGLPFGLQRNDVVFDSVRGVAVGAWSSNGFLANIYELQNHTWRRVGSPESILYFLYSAKSLFDSTRGLCLFFTDPNPPFIRTWDGNQLSWLSPSPALIPSPQVLIADPIRDVIVNLSYSNSYEPRIEELDLATGLYSLIPVQGVQVRQGNVAGCWHSVTGETVFVGRDSETGAIITWSWNGTRLATRLIGFPDADPDLAELISDESRGVLVLVSSGKTYELAALPPAPAIISFTPALRNLRRGNTARLDVTTSNDADLAKVEIWRDVNSNNELDLDVDFKLGDTTRGTNNRWTASLSTRNWPAGQQQLLAVAYEEFTNATSFLATPMTIVNSIPMLPGFTATPRRIATPSTPMTVTALRPTDIDGTVTRIDYFIDHDRSGARGANEPLFSTTNLTARLNVPTGLLSYGFNQIVAHAVDNDGARSLPVRQRVYVNRPPVTTAFSATPSTISGTTATFTLSVTGTDVDGSITGAEFWWDVNNNGIIDSTVDRKIGTPRRVGTTNTWTSTQPRGTILTGQQRFIGRLIDNERVNSASTSPVTVTFN